MFYCFGDPARKAGIISPLFMMQGTFFRLTHRSDPVSADAACPMLAVFRAV
jgi:hypothetical protein